MLTVARLVETAHKPSISDIKESGDSEEVRGSAKDEITVDPTEDCPCPMAMLDSVHLAADKLN